MQLSSLLPDFNVSHTNTEYREKRIQFTCALKINMEIHQNCPLRYIKQRHKPTARKSTGFTGVQNGSHKDHCTRDIYTTPMEGLSPTILA
jgi:hypothetical protein